MRNWKLGLVGILALVVVAFSAVSYYDSKAAEGRDIIEKQARARWTWILASQKELDSVIDDEELSDDCSDCNGEGFVGDGTIKVECDTCNGTGKRGFQMTILKMPVQPIQADCEDGSCTVQGKPIRAAAKRGRVFAGRIIRKIRCRK